MEPRTDQERYVDRVILLFLFAVFLLVSPLKMVWSGAGSPWYTPYVIWAAIIALAALLQRRRKRHAL